MALLLAAACKSGGGAAAMKEAKPASGPVVSTAPPSDAGPQPSSVALSVGELWKLAPQDAVSGAVLSPVGVEMLERVLSRLSAVPAQWADETLLGRLFAYARAFQGRSLSNVGISTRRPFAIFHVKEGWIFVMPVEDREGFASVFEGVRQGDVDHYRFMTCKLVHGGYACATAEPLLSRMGGGTLGEVYAAAALPTRGDLQVVGRNSPPGQMVLAAEFGSGSIHLAGMFKDMPLQTARMMVRDPQVLEVGDEHNSAVLADLRAVLAEYPDVSILRGLTAKSLIRAVGGPLRLRTTPGAWRFEGTLPLLDTTAFASLLRRCHEVPVLGDFLSAVKDGCRMTLPGSAVAFDMWIDGKTLHLGQRRGVATSSRKLPFTALQQSLFPHPWGAAIWARGIGLAPPPLLPPQSDGERRVQESLLSEVKRAMLLVNELSLGVRLGGPGEPNTFRFVLGVRTLFANPASLVDKVMAIGDEQIATGQGESLLKEIAATAPDSLLAGDVEAGGSGLSVPIFVVLTAIARTRLESSP